MGYRVAREDWQMSDPVAVASTAGGVNVYHDGATTPPWQPRPGQSKEQYIVSEALRLMAVPAEEIRAQRPPVPYEIFPEQQGYFAHPLTIGDVLDTDRWAPQRRSWMSGTVRRPRRSDMDGETWNGSSRNSISMGANPAG